MNLNRRPRIEFDEAAYHHAFDELDALSAIAHPLRHLKHFDDDRKTGEPASAWIGPARGGRTIEVFAKEVRPTLTIVFHIEDVRQTTINRFDELEATQEGTE